MTIEGGGLYYIVDPERHFWNGQYWTSLLSLAKSYELDEARGIVAKRFANGRHSKHVAVLSTENFKKAPKPKGKPGRRFYGLG